MLSRSASFVSFTLAIRRTRLRIMKGRQIRINKASIGMKFCPKMNSPWPRNMPAKMRTEIVPITEERMLEGDDSAGIVRIRVSDIDQRAPIEQP